MSNYRQLPNHLWLNDGDGNFIDVAGGRGVAGNSCPVLPALNPYGHTIGSAWGDFDNDGDLDLIADGKMFRNATTNRNHWLKVRLKRGGVSVNTMAVGSQVRIDLGGQVLTRQVEGATGEQNQNDPLLHFGLGSHAQSREWKVRNIPLSLSRNRELG